MQSLELVYEQYLPTTHETVGGKSIRRKLKPDALTSVDLAIQQGLPAVLEKAIIDNGRDPNNYRISSSGQNNFFIPRVPWVSILDLDITAHTTRGYYVVLLFREDMQGCVLSLNQGYTEFKEIYALPRIATEKIRESAERATHHVDLPQGFVKGVIDLSATDDLGQGYENGAIVSKVYPRFPPLSETELTHDIGILLDVYADLKKRAGKSLASLVPPLSEDEYQEAAAAITRTPSEKFSSVSGPSRCTFKKDSRDTGVKYILPFLLMGSRRQKSGLPSSRRPRSK